MQTNNEVELILSITLEYKTNKTHQKKKKSQSTERRCPFIQTHGKSAARKVKTGAIVVAFAFYLRLLSDTRSQTNKQTQMMKGKSNFLDSRKRLSEVF